MVKKKTQKALYHHEFHSLKLAEVYFVTQGMLYLGEGPWALDKKAHVLSSGRPF